MNDNNSPLIDYSSFNFGNFNIDEILNEEIICTVFVVDTSASTTNFVADLNKAFNEFVEVMQKSHVAPTLFVSIIEFDKTIRTRSGFQPIANIPTNIDF